MGGGGGGVINGKREGNLSAAPNATKKSNGNGPLP